MTIDQFFRKFKKLPLKKRFTVMNFGEYGRTTITDVYKGLIALEEQKMPIEKNEARLLIAAEEYFKNISKT